MLRLHFDAIFANIECGGESPSSMGKRVSVRTRFSPSPPALGHTGADGMPWGKLDDSLKSFPCIGPPP